MTRSVRPGRPWGRAVTGAPDVEVTGDDAALAAIIAARPGARVRFHPEESDLARAVGLTGMTPGSGPREEELELPVDAIALDGGRGMAVNAVTLGVAPDRLRWTSGTQPVEVVIDGRARFAGRASSVVVASGQYLRGADLVPRGHPGDGRLEVQVYELRRGERRGMRRRLGSGAHLPHPRIHQLAGCRIEVRAPGRALRLEVDGRAAGRVSALGLEVAPAAVWVMV